MKYIIFSCLIGMSLSAYAQRATLLLKDGQEIDLKKWKPNAEELVITTMTKEKLTVPMAYIEVLRDELGEWCYRLYDDQDPFQPGLHYIQVRREAQGAVNCYSRLHTRHTDHGTTSTYFLFLENDTQPLTVIHSSNVLKSGSYKAHLEDNFDRFFERIPNFLRGVDFRKLKPDEKIAIVKSYNAQLDR